MNAPGSHDRRPSESTAGPLSRPLTLGLATGDLALQFHRLAYRNPHPFLRRRTLSELIRMAWKRELFVLAHGNQVVGGLYVTPVEGGLMELGGLYVMPTLQGLGLGRALVQHALDHVGALGIPIEAHVRSENRGCRRLLLAAGFELELANLAVHNRSMSGLDHMPSDSDGYVMADLLVFRSSRGRIAPCFLPQDIFEVGPAQPAACETA